MADEIGLIVTPQLERQGMTNYDGGFCGLGSRRD